MTASEFEISRRWWFPFVVEVWQRGPKGEHWKRGEYRVWYRRGVFFRRSTAERFVEWLRCRALAGQAEASYPIATLGASS